MDRKNLRKWLRKASSKKLASGFAYLIIGVGLTACISSPVKESQTAQQKTRTPDWVLNPPSDGRYLYGVGSAEKFEDLVQSTTLARRQANADIASQLKVTVSQSNIQSTEVTSGSDQSEQVLTSLASQTRIDIEALALEQSETVESTISGKYVYVLQRLDRARIVTRLRQEIEDIDAEFTAIATEIDTNSDLVSQWRSMLPALPLMAARAQAVKSLKLYSKTAVSTAKSQQFQTFEKQLNTLLMALAIHVESQVPDSRSLTQNIRSGLTEKGLTPSTASSQLGKAPLKIMLHASSTIETQGDRTYVFLTINAALQQQVGQQSMLANWTITKRGVSAIASQAKIAAEKKAAMELANEVFTYLTQDYDS